MSMFTRFLYIEGDDFGAAAFEQEFETQEEREAFAEEVVENEGELGCADYVASIRDYDGDISEAFLSNILDDLCDYDTLKGRCYYRINLMFPATMFENT